MKPQVIAHRGACAQARENTLEAFRLAAELGADWVEMDVRKTADSVLVLHHDARLPQDPTQSIAQTHSGDLPEHIPTLAEALEACEGIGVILEIKNDPNEPGYDSQNQISVAVAGTLTAYTQQQMVISFNLASIDRIRATDPGIATGLLVFDPMMSAQGIEVAVEGGHGLISFHESLVTSKLVRQAHDKGLAVHTWTVNQPDTMRRVLADGVDGIVSDYPDLALEVVAEFAGADGGGG